MNINEARSDARDALRQTKDSAAPPALQIALLRAALEQLLAELDKLCDDEEPSPPPAATQAFRDYVVQPGDCYGCHGHGGHDGSWHEAVAS